MMGCRSDDAARATRLLATIVLACAAMPPAQAMRPFDGTDAAVVRQGGLEFEFGYLGLLREDGRTFLSSPALVANLGVAPGTAHVAEVRAGLTWSPR
jgi:hypothetical protein